MKNKYSVIFDFLVFAAIIIFALLAHISMRFIEFEEQLSSSTNYLKFGFAVLSLMAMVISRTKLWSSFTFFWFLWIVWLFFDFYLLGLKGSGIADYFVVILAPISFVLFYYASLNSQKIDIIALIGFFVVFILALFQTIQQMNLILLYSFLGEEGSQSNIVYWCLCPLPFLMMLKKRWQQGFVLLVMSAIGLLTGKRSVFFVLALVIAFYSFDIFKGKKKFGTVLVFVLLFVVGTGVLMHFMGDFIGGIVERLSHMGEEGDSSMSRIIIYEACFDVLKNNNFADWLFGRGYETVRMLTTHTNAHNDALQMLFEYGIIGLIFYLCMLYYCIKRLILLKKRASPYYMGYMASVVIFVVLGMVSNLVVFYSYFAYICAYWGMVEARIVQESAIKRRLSSQG